MGHTPRIMRSASLPLLARQRQQHEGVDAGIPTRLVDSRTPERLSTQSTAELASEGVSRSKPGVGMSTQAFIETVRTMHESVRQHYRPGKSANKCRISAIHQKERAVADRLRCISTYEILSALQISNAPLIERIEAGVGNCLEMASHSALLAQHLGLTATIWGFRDPDLGHSAHAFCLIAEPGKDAIPATPGAKLPDSGWVSDPWAGIVCHVTDYDAHMKQKMAKWDAEKKHIYCCQRQEWLAPLDPRWLNTVAIAQAAPSHPVR